MKHTDFIQIICHGGNSSSNTNKNLSLRCRHIRGAGGTGVGDAVQGKASLHVRVSPSGPEQRTRAGQHVEAHEPRLASLGHEDSGPP